MVVTHRDNRMMDEQDATDTLTFVVVRLVTRAAKRAVEEEAAADGTSVWPTGHAYWCGPGGPGRAAKRAKIAARPVKVRRSVDNLGRSHVW